MIVRVRQGVDESLQEAFDRIQSGTYRNPEPDGRYNLVVIGGGTAGAVTAIGAAALGARVAVIERDACRSSAMVDGAAFTVLRDIARSVFLLQNLNSSESGEIYPTIFLNVLDCARTASDNAVTSHLSALLGSDLDYFSGTARFTGKDSIEVGNTTLQFSRALIATGSHLESSRSSVAFSQVLQLRSLPSKISVDGCGAMAAELAQIFARLGCETNLVYEESEFLAGEDNESIESVMNALRHDGVRFRMNDNSAKYVLSTKKRIPNLAELNLEAADIEYDENGILINNTLSTTNRRVFACGGVVSGMESAFVSEAAARMAIGNALFFASHKFSKLTIPVCILTDPVIARVGVRNEEVTGRGLLTTQLPVVDGVVKIFHDSAGSILGASVVHPFAEELIGHIVISMNHHIKLGAYSSDVLPRFSRGELLRQSGDIYRKTLLTPLVAKMIHKFLEWRR